MKRTDGPDAELEFSSHEKVLQSICKSAVSNEEVHLQFTWQCWRSEVLIRRNRWNGEAARSSRSVGSEEPAESEEASVPESVQQRGCGVLSSPRLASGNKINTSQERRACYF